MSRQTEKMREPVSPAGGATGGRMPADERRRQIAAVATRLFSESGFRGTTTKEIAQAAGVSEAIIFRHFATKEELYSAIIDYKSCAGLGADPSAHAEATASGEHNLAEDICSLMGDAMERGDDRAVFEGLALAMMEHHQNDPELLRLLLYSALEGHQLAQIFWDRNVRVLYEVLGAYISRRRDEGALRDVNPLVVVRALTGAIIHHTLNNILWDTDPARRILNIPNEEAASAFADLFLHGVAAEEKAVAAKRKGATDGRAAKSRKR